MLEKFQAKQPGTLLSVPIYEIDGILIASCTSLDFFTIFVLLLLAKLFEVTFIEAG
jgi:hypothetical protein